MKLTPDVSLRQPTHGRLDKGVRFAALGSTGRGRYGLARMATGMGRLQTRVESLDGA